MDFIDSWRKTHYAHEVTPNLDGKEVTLMGWAREIRLHGKIGFLILADRSGDCQAFIKGDLFDKLKELNREDVVAIKGKVQKTDKSNRGVEVVISDLKVLNKSKTPLPLDVAEKTPADFDTRFDARVLDLRRPKVAAIFKIRGKILEAAREYFTKDGFMEIETPKMIAAASEGGAELFPIKYFGEAAFLRQSPQIYKELMTSAFEKVFEIGPVFRAEPSDTTRHLTEVTQMDIEMGFATEEDTWAVMEGLIPHIYKKVKEECSDSLEALDVDLQVPKTPFEKKSYEEIIELANKHDIKLKFGDDIPPAVERLITETYKKPTITYNWPMELKPYYVMPHEDKPELSHGFDLVMDGLELASGGRRIHDADLYTEMIRKKGMNPENFKEIIEFYRLGMPPHAGWAIGVDRLTMIICGLENVKEAVLFPRDMKRLTP